MGVTIGGIQYVREACLLPRSHVICRNNNQSANCRMYNGAGETVRQVIYCSQKWLSALYIDLRDSIARNIYYILCRKNDLQRNETVQETHRIKLYWNQQLQTRNFICHNTDLLAFDKISKIAIIIGVTVFEFTSINKQMELKTSHFLGDSYWCNWSSALGLKRTNQRRPSLNLSNHFEFNRAASTKYTFRNESYSSEALGDPRQSILFYTRNFNKMLLVKPRFILVTCILRGFNYFL